MPSKPTPLALELQAKLRSRGIETITEYWDGHKHVDLYVPSAKIYIEVDGIRHLTSPKQIIADFKREYYSDINNFNTLRINNDVLIENLDDISEAIADVVNERKRGFF